MSMSPSNAVLNTTKLAQYPEHTTKQHFSEYDVTSSQKAKVESPCQKGGMPPKVSKTFTENKDSSYIQWVNLAYLGLSLFIWTTILYFKYIFWKKMHVVSLFAISFRGFVVYKQPFSIYHIHLKCVLLVQESLIAPYHLLNMAIIQHTKPL